MNTTEPISSLHTFFNTLFQNEGAIFVNLTRIQNNLTVDEPFASMNENSNGFIKYISLDPATTTELIGMFRQSPEYEQFINGPVIFAYKRGNYTPKPDAVLSGADVFSLGKKHDFVRELLSSPLRK
jgi:hypothetical protein